MLTNTPVGSVMLTGTVEQEVLERTFSTETGSWTDALVAVVLGGPLNGHTLRLTLDPGQTSSGTTSIMPIGAAGFDISSFFDVFVDLSPDQTPPLQTSVGPVRFTASPAPEPASLTLLVLPILALWTTGGTARTARTA